MAGKGRPPLNSSSRGRITTKTRGEHLPKEVFNLKVETDEEKELLKEALEMRRDYYRRIYNQLPDRCKEEKATAEAKIRALTELIVRLRK